MNWTREKGHGFVLHFFETVREFQCCCTYLSAAITEGRILRLHAGNKTSLGLVVRAVAIRVACERGVRMWSGPQRQVSVLQYIQSASTLLTAAIMMMAATAQASERGEGIVLDVQENVVVVNKRQNKQQGTQGTGLSCGTSAGFCTATNEGCEGSSRNC